MQKEEQFSINRMHFSPVQKPDSIKMVLETPPSQNPEFLNTPATQILPASHFSIQVLPRKRGVRTGVSHPNPTTQPRSNQTKDRFTGVPQNLIAGQVNLTKDIHPPQPKAQVRGKVSPNEKRINPISIPEPHPLLSQKDTVLPLLQIPLPVIIPHPNTLHLQLLTEIIPLKHINPTGVKAMVRIPFRHIPERKPKPPEVKHQPALNRTDPQPEIILPPIIQTPIPGPINHTATRVILRIHISPVIDLHTDPSQPKTPPDHPVPLTGILSKLQPTPAAPLPIHPTIFNDRRRLVPLIPHPGDHHPNPTLQDHPLHPVREEKRISQTLLNRSIQGSGTPDPCIVQFIPKPRGKRPEI
jgi:hypothetical protein